MKSAVTRFAIFLGVVALFVPFLGLHADTTCECPNPPGGTVTCPDGNFIICVVKDGKASSKCWPISEDLKKNEASLQAWVLTKVLDRKVEPEEVKKDEHQTILKKERYENKETGRIVTFKLPKDK
jgi:hypothetical protein